MSKAYIAVHKTDNDKWTLETHPARSPGKTLAFDTIDEMAESLKKLDTEGDFEPELPAPNQDSYIND